MMVLVVTMVRLMAMVMVVASYRGLCHKVIETVSYDDDDDSPSSVCCLS